jgi:DNA repair exonuclease SbcCD ATPase subunit
MEQIGSEYNFKTGGAIKELNDVIARVDALEKAQAKLGKTSKETGDSVGATGTKVKKAKTEFDSLGNSINQVTREFPAFAFSAQTGFLAISNNIPILLDSINSLKKANADLAAQGKASIPVFKQVIASLFSWQTALSLLISFSVLYGKELGNFISNLFKSGSAVDDLTLKISALNNAYNSKELKGNIEGLVQLRNNIDLAQSGYLSKEAVLKVYNKEFGKILGTTNDINIAEKNLIDATPELIKAYANRAAAASLVSDAAQTIIDIQKKQQEVDDIENNKNQGAFQQFRDAVAIGQQITDKGVENARTKRLNAAKNELNDLKLKLKTELDVSAKFSEDAEKVLIGAGEFDEERKKKALSAFQQLQKDISDTEDAFKSANLKGLDTTEIEAKFKSLTEQLEKVKAAYDELTGEAAKKRAKEFQDTLEAALKDVEDAAQEAGRIGALDLKKRRKEDKEAEKKALDEKKENLQEELNANTEFFINLREEKEYSKRELTLLDIAELESKIEILKTSKDASVENEKEILSIQKLISRLKRKANKESNDEIIDDDKERARQQKAILQEIAQFGFSVSNGYFDLKKAQLRDETDIQLEELDKQKEARIISEEDYNNKKKAILNEENQKQRELDLAQIKVQTALAVIRAFATAPNPIIGAFLASLAAAEGAIQYSFAQAQPLPRFAKGTDRVIGGVKGQDSVHALLMPDEAVIPAKENMARPQLAKAWISGNLDNHLMMNYIKPAIEENNKKWEAVLKVNQNSTFIRNDNFNDKKIVGKLDIIARRLGSNDNIRISRRNNRLWNK